jgi:DNA-3-methyladenine glycosylase II
MAKQITKNRKHATRKAPSAGWAALAGSEAEFERARRALMRRDARLAPLIKKTGRCRLPDGRTRHPFAALVRAILSQQLSGKAADTIHGRMVAALGGPDCLTAERLLAADPVALRAAGVSGPKIKYLRDLAERVVDGRLDLHALDVQSDEEVITALTAVKGMGRWTAEMFLMFRLNRPDIFPLDDLGIVKGVQKLFGMKRRPKPSTMTRLAEPWRPYRSIAAWYIWRIHE